MKTIIAIELFILIALMATFQKALKEPIVEERRYIIVRTAYIQEVTVTAYAPVRNQTDSTPHVTATKTLAKPGRTCAVSRDLAKMGWLGKTLYIEGYGVWKAEDVMAKKWKKRIDLCMNPKQAKRFTPQKTWAIPLD